LLQSETEIFLSTQESRAISATNRFPIKTSGTGADMPAFKRITPERAQSPDGVAVIIKDRFRIRYQRPEKLCDLSCAPFIDQIGMSVGRAIALTREAREVTAIGV
jgi:hypothetical protein